MNKQIKMVAFDLDGTLLNSEKKMSEATIEALEKAIAQGVVVLPATGRPLVGVPKELKDFPGIQYAVTANGARVVNIKTGETVCESTLALEMAEKILDIFDRYDCHQEIFANGVSYANKKCEANIYDYFKSRHHAEYTLNTRKFVGSVRMQARELGLPLEKVQAMFCDEESFKDAKNKLDQLEGIVATDAIGMNWEVNRAGTDKGNALIELGKILGIEKDEIMALGDGMNDYAMIKKVGFGVVMENGVDELKKIAKHITASNDEDGVVKAIEQFVLK